MITKLNGYTLLSSELRTEWNQTNDQSHLIFFEIDTSYNTSAKVVLSDQVRTKLAIVMLIYTHPCSIHNSVAYSITESNSEQTRHIAAAERRLSSCAVDFSLATAADTRTPCGPSNTSTR